MTYQYSIAKLTTMASGAQGPRCDDIGDHIALALAERVEALATEMEKINGHLEALTQIGPILAELNPKMDALVEATKHKTV